MTGASGYIGGRLFPELLIRGYQVRLMIREESPIYKNLWPDVEVAVADALNRVQLKQALAGIDTAYYLIHSLYLGPKAFSAADIQAAVNFRETAEEQQVKRIIYLGGLGDVKASLSAHLRSRIEVAEELKKNDYEVRFAADKVKEQLMVIYIDIFGNEKRRNGTKKVLCCVHPTC